MTNCTDSAHCAHRQIFLMEIYNLRILALQYPLVSLFMTTPEMRMSWRLSSTTSPPPPQKKAI